MDEAAIIARIRELNEMVTTPPLIRPEDKGDAEGVYQSQAPAREIDVDDVLAQLRLHLKYLLFDLDATRRENRYLRQMLEARTKRNPNHEDDGSNWQFPPGL